MPPLHVLTRREELETERIADKIVVVIDVLFATSTIVAALAHGAREVVVALDETGARAAAAALAPGSYVLAGEYHLQSPAGFASFAPLALLAQELAGKRLIYATTNGTVALRQAEGAAHVYAAALLNSAAVAEQLRARHAQDTVLILCAGSIGRLNLEDLYGAGLLVDRLLADAPACWQPSDAALAVQALYQRYGRADAEHCLLQSRVGQLMIERGAAEEVRFAARLDAYPIVPSLRNGRMR
jgi:2-phosphosulfolactate phosphatase